MCDRTQPADFGAVIVAAGSSSRMGTGRPKVLEDLGGRPVLRWSLEALAASPRVAELAVVCRAEDREAVLPLTRDLGKPVTLVDGGSRRQDSVRRGVEALSPGLDAVLIHDGARPLVSGELIERVCADTLRYGAATAAVPVKDTVKQGGDFAESTPPRESLRAVQTPQGFSRSLYLRALAAADAAGQSYTDDCQLVEALGERVRLTEGDYRNLKLTTPEDLLTLRALAGEQTKEEKGMRIGSGYDVHRLVEGRKLILAGVEIPYEKGLLGHSDADVLTHAVCDAILGAAAMGDIGHLFPDTDPRWEGADSLKLLEEVCRLVREAGFAIGNLDATLIAQRPKIAPYIPVMRAKLAIACGVDEDRVSVKATTEEGLGFTGAGEGMSATAVCLLTD